MPGELGRCESCGREEEELAAVRRVYAEADPTEPGRLQNLRAVDEVEHWCFSCRSHYLHEETEDSEPEDGPGTGTRPSDGDGGGGGEEPGGAAHSGASSD